VRGHLAIAVLTLAGCHRQPTFVAMLPPAVLRHVDELRTDGQAQIETVRIHGHSVEAADVETVFLEQTVSRGTHKNLSLATLVEGCSATSAAATCGLLERDDPILLREFAAPPPREARHGNAPAIVVGGFALGALGGMVYCLSECTSNKPLKSIGLGAAAALLGLVSAALAGATIRD